MMPMTSNSWHRPHRLTDGIKALPNSLFAKSKGQSPDYSFSTSMINRPLATKLHFEELGVPVIVEFRVFLLRH